MGEEEAGDGESEWESYTGSEGARCAALQLPSGCRPALSCFAPVTTDWVSLRLFAQARRRRRRRREQMRRIRLPLVLPLPHPSRLQRPPSPLLPPPLRFLLRQTTPRPML